MFLTRPESFNAPAIAHASCDDLSHAANIGLFLPLACRFHPSGVHCRRERIHMPRSNSRVVVPVSLSQRILRRTVADAPLPFLHSLAYFLSLIHRFLSMPFIWPLQPRPQSCEGRKKGLRPVEVDLSGLSEILGLIRTFNCLELYACHHVYQFLARRVGERQQRSLASSWPQAALV